jgi:6-phosphogluconate dehydrogenase
VAGYTKGQRSDISHEHFTLVRSLDRLPQHLARPRKILLYVPAGAAVEESLEQLSGLLETGDIVMDGGNSYWGDSIRRARRLAEAGIHWVDVGTSGGIDGARHGACFMVGGDRGAVDEVAPLLRRLAVPGGYVHAGEAGAGHFVKLVHNGIEFGMLQAIGEGTALLESYPQPLPLHDILECWRHGSVIRSWLIDLLTQAVGERRLEDVPPIVEDTGEVNWLVADALELEVPIPVISEAVTQLAASRDPSRTWARAIALMRHGFGGHPFGASLSLRRERHTSRLGGFVAPAARTK